MWDSVKDQEMGGLSWVIQVGPKCDHKYPCEREAEGGLVRTGEERGREHRTREWTDEATTARGWERQGKLP